MVKAIYFSSFFTLWIIQRISTDKKCREAMYMYWTLVLLVLTETSLVSSLERNWVNRITGSNCSLSAKQFLSKSIQLKKNGTESNHQHTDCPPWYYQSDEGQCRFGNSINNIVITSPSTLQSSILHFYCMTTENNSTTVILGGCLYTSVYPHLERLPLPCNVSELDNYMCAGLNREGKSCGRCKEGFAPSVYSYSMSCANCTSHQHNWVKYILTAFGPLTLFLLFITVLHISPTSSYLHGFMFFSHIISLPHFSHIISLEYRFNENVLESEDTVYMGESLLSLFGVWSLDFFRYLYTPFCIHPGMTTVQALALDYLIAVYPLLLLLLAYVMVQLHSRSFKPAVYLWNAVHPVMKCLKSHLKVETSLVNSFATVFLLSSVKFQSVTFDLLLPTKIYFINGSSDGKFYLFLAGDVEYFGSEHLPYAILALCTLLTLIVFPALLMFLYPCACFQRLLNRLRCNSLALHTFMDVYQGNYKDGTNNTRDYRYFSGVFFFARTAVIISIASLNSYYFTVILGLLFIALAMSIALLHPQKSQLSFTMDILFTSALSVIFLVSTFKPVTPHNFNAIVSLVVSTLTACSPFLYIFVLILIWLFVKVRLPQRLVEWVKNRRTSSVHMRDNCEYAPIQ